MRKEVMIVLVAILLSSVCVAAQIANIPQMDTDFTDITGIDLGEDVANMIVVVPGSNMNLLERGALEGLKRGVSSVRNAQELPDTLDSLDELAETKKTIMFFGGPTQSNLVELYLPTLEEQDFRDYGPFVALYGKNNGRQVVIFSDARGFNNLERMSARVSPLNQFVPEQYVPIAAAGISVFLLILLDFLATLFENYIQMIGTRRKEIKDDFTGFEIGNFVVRWREVLSISVAAVFFAAALAWMWTAGGDNFGEVFLLSVGVSIVVFVVQEGLRMFFAWQRGATTEFVIYPLGIAIGIISTFLGSLLAGPGAWLFKDEEHPGPIYYGVMLTVFISSTIFFGLNVMYPSQLMQVIMTTTSTVSFFEFFPIAPINGAEIYRWNKKVWWVTIIVLTPIYILINFFL